jgi:hypothetical protein
MGVLQQILARGGGGAGIGGGEEEDVEDDDEEDDESGDRFEELADPLHFFQTFSNVIRQHPDENKIAVLGSGADQRCVSVARAFGVELAQLQLRVEGKGFLPITQGLVGTQQSFSEGWAETREECGLPDTLLSVHITTDFEQPENSGFPEGFWGWGYGRTVLAGENAARRNSDLLEVVEVGAATWWCFSQDSEACFVCFS